jgi:adenylate cyclase, class 2
MLEIEQKFARVDFADLERRLASWGATPSNRLEEADHYFNAPDRDFARTDEVFRLRRVGSANYLTYKGPKRPAAVKSRVELEVPIAGGDRAAEQFVALLKFLGYRHVAIVRKRRRQYQLQRGSFVLTVCLDEVEGLGSFAELEILAPEEQQSEAAAMLADTASSLGLFEVERRSYLGLILGAGASDGGPARREEARS